jgi:hypothetical protein
MGNADRVQCSQLKNNFDFFAQVVRKTIRAATIEWMKAISMCRPGRVAPHSTDDGIEIQPLKPKFNVGSGPPAYLGCQARRL